MPFIVRVPGRVAAVRDEPVTLNILPTLVMEALGGSWPVSTASEAAIQEFHIRSELVWRAIRQPPWSYHHRVLDGTVELYHLGDDPGEARDVAADHPEVVKRLSAMEPTSSR